MLPRERPHPARLAHGRLPGRMAWASWKERIVRRNTAGKLGGIVRVVVCMLLVVALYPPATYLSPPVVQLGFVIPGLVACFVVHALAGYPTALLTAGALGLRAWTWGYPVDQVLAFTAFAGFQLASVMTITAIVAWGFHRALRDATRHQRDLDQRGEERTALLRAQSERAHRLLAERKALYAAIAHDLRRDAMQLLALTDQFTTAWREGDTAEAAAHERRLLRFVRRQAAYARDINDVSLVAEGVPLPMRPTLVALPEMTVRLVDDMVPDVVGFPITLSVETRADVHAAWCDSDRTERILRNLVVNAIDAVKVTGQPGSVTVVISAPDATFLRCDVVNSGCGIAPEHLVQLGHRFVRVRLPGMDGDGMGMGLTLSAQLVTLMGGQLTLTSPGVGFGACASFTVPAYQLAAGDELTVRADASQAGLVT